MSVGRRALRGAVWLTAANYAAYAVTFAADLLLARWLYPSDFGTVALAVAVLEILGRVTSLGIPTLIAQHQGLLTGLKY